MGLLKWLFGGSKEGDKYQATIQPNIDFSKANATYFSNAGKFDLEKGKGDIDYLTTYFKDMLTGTPDHILQNVDASSITAGMDDQLQNTLMNAPRGGARAGMSSQIQFDKNAAINKAIQDVRNMAPQHLETLAKMLLDVGAGETQAGTDANDSVVNMLNFVQQVKESERARKAGIFKSYITAMAGAAGAAAAGG